MKCIICGRKLKRGTVGPVCRKKIAPPQLDLFPTHTKRKREKLPPEVKLQKAILKAVTKKQ